MEREKARRKASKTVYGKTKPFAVSPHEGGRRRRRQKRREEEAGSRD